MRIQLSGIVLLACACGGSGASSPAPVSSSPQAVLAFMRAAADSNLRRMAELWGTSRGPASVTRPANFEKIIFVLQVYLRGDSTKILSDAAMPGDDGRRKVSLALYRGPCVKQIPATTVRLRDGGWIIQAIDITFAGNPARPCDPGSEPPADPAGLDWLTP